MDPATIWAAALVAVATVLTTCGLQIASFIRAGNSEKRAEARAAEALDYARKAAELLAAVKTNTDGLAAAAKDTADRAAVASTEARDKDRASMERTQTAGALAAAIRAPASEAPATPAVPPSVTHIARQDVALQQVGAIGAAPPEPPKP